MNPIETVKRHVNAGAMHGSAAEVYVTPNAVVTVGNVTFSNAGQIAVFAGPCQMESRAHALEMAIALKEIAAKLGLGLVY